MNYEEVQSKLETLNLLTAFIALNPISVKICFFTDIFGITLTNRL